MKIDFYHYNVHEAINWENIYKALIELGAEAQLIVEPPGKNAFTSLTPDGYERIINYLQERNYPCHSQPRYKDADAAITTQVPNWLQHYKGLKINTLYGSTLTKDCWGYQKKKLAGFDGICAHGQYSRQRIIANGIPPEKIAIMGFPKYVDYFRANVKREQWQRKFGLNPERKTITYLPSWHKNSSIDAFLDAIAGLSEDFNVLIKPHHCNVEMEEYRFSKMRNLKNVSFQDAPQSSVPFYVVGDIVIADTRSGAFAEGILTNSRLIGLHVRNNTEADFVEPVVYQLAPICETPDQLLEAVNEFANSGVDKYQANKERLKPYLFTDFQGRDDCEAAKAIIKFVEQNKQGTISSNNYVSVKSAVESVEGYLVPGQEEFLFNKVKSLYEDAVIVEIGSYKGRSSVAMGYACIGTDRKIYCIDIWENNPFDIWRENIEKRRLDRYVIPLRGRSHDILSRWNELTGGKKIDFIFIDGSHQYSDVLKDFEMSYPLVKKGGYIALHDVVHDWPGPERVWHEAAKNVLVNHEYSSTLACGQKHMDEHIIEQKIAGYCVVRNAEYLSYPFYDAIYQCLDNVDEFHIFYDVGSEDGTISLTEKFVNALSNYYPIEMHPIKVDWKDQSAISQAQNLGARFLKEKGFEFVLLNQADEFLPVGMKEFLKDCYRNKQQVGFDVIHTWKDEYIITTAPYCRFYRSDTEFTGDGANVCNAEVKDFIMHSESVHHFGTLFHPERKYACHSKLYGSKDQEYIAANANDLDKVQEGFKRLIGTEKFIRRAFPLREREYITVRYSREHGSYPFELALQEIVADIRRKRNCKESFAITYSNTQGFRESLAVSLAWTDAYGVVESLIKKFNIKTGAEIGVARGHHSAHLLEANPNLKWIAIDSWKHTVNGYEDPSNMPQEEFDETYESTRKLLGQFGDRITILRKTSREASEIVQEKLDIVFVDANHSYESVKEDIALWWNKVKPGGIIAGHDYDHPDFPGTKRAVDEFLGSKGLIPKIELGTVWWAQKRPGHFLTYIVPCYNCAGTVFEAIKSIYQQNLDIPFEVICTEDGSTDSTRQILSYCQQKLPNFHVYYHDQNKGGAAARNTCVANSRGDLIFCLDSDNILTPDSVGKLINLLDDTGCDGASFAELRYFEGTKGIHRHTHSWFFEAPNNICDISHILSTQKTPAASGNYLYTRESYDRAGGYPEGRGAVDSWGFGFRQHATGTKIAILPDSFYWHRLSSSGYWTREEKTGANSKNAASIVREFPELFTDETNSFLATAEAEKCFFRHLESGRLKTVSGQSLVCQSQDTVISMKGPQGLLPVQNDGFNVGNLQARSDNAEIKPTSDAVRHTPDFTDARLFLKKLDSSSAAHQHHTDINSNISAGYQLSLKENIIQQLKERGLSHTNQPLRLHLGCGEQHLEGYVNIDYPQSEHNLVQVKADVCADIKSLDFPPGSVDEIRLHHVFEHFNRVTALAMLIKWHKWLKIGGRLHIETPDLIGSAKALVSNTSWKTKMGVVRHLAGDQAADWGYHIDHWFPERFEHTLEALGFGEVQTLSSSWSKEPYLSNVKVVAMKSKPFSLQEQLKAAEELLWESTVATKERPTWEIWKKQLRAVLAGDFIASPSNTQTPNVSSVSAAPIVLSQNSSQLPLDEIHDFNQRSRDRWVRAKAKTIPAGSRVLDIGAGTCPYRSLFAHCDYKTHDFKKYKGIKLGNTTEYGKLDYESDITSIPVADKSFDVILCTEVLEHIPEPIEALREMARILRRGGQLLITAPLGSGLHQTPYHYYGGYTPQWYKHFLPKFGLHVKEISPNGGFFKLLAQECARVAWTLPQHKHLHGNNVEPIRQLFGEWLPRYLYALDEQCFIDQFTVGYHIEAQKLPVPVLDKKDIYQPVSRNI